MIIFSQEIKTIGGKFIQSGVSQSIHPVIVFWTWLRFILKIGFILLITHGIAFAIGVALG